MTNTGSGRQVLLTVAMGKRLSGNALVADSVTLEAAKYYCLITILGSTNAQIATAVMVALSLPFSLEGFYRGLQRGNEQVSNPTPPQMADFIVKEGQCLKGKIIFDVVDTLGSNDIVLKGANAIHLESHTAGILIAGPVGDIIIPITSVAVGHRTHLIRPTGLEKRTERSILELVRFVNRNGQKGPRSMESCGDTYTELDVVRDLFSLHATLPVIGDVLGVEGSAFLQLSSNEEDLRRAEAYPRSTQDTPSFSF